MGVNRFQVCHGQNTVGKVCKIILNMTFLLLLFTFIAQTKFFMSRSFERVPLNSRVFKARGVKHRCNIKISNCMDVAGVIEERAIEVHSSEVCGVQVSSCCELCESYPACKHFVWREKELWPKAGCESGQPYCWLLKNIKEVQPSANGTIFGTKADMPSCPTAVYKWRASYEFRGRYHSNTKIIPIHNYSSDKITVLKSNMRDVCKRVEFHQKCPQSKSSKIPNLGGRSSRTDVKLQQRLYNDSLILSGKSRKGVNCTHLMIVSHPDDDAIWGGEVLGCTNLFNEYKCWKVVVMSDGGRKSTIDWPRVEDFKVHSNFFGADYEMWKTIDSHMLNVLLHSQKWDIVLTHGPFGEYGAGGHKELFHLVLKNLPAHLYDKFYIFNPKPNAPKNPNNVPS